MIEGLTLGAITWLSMVLSWFHLPTYLKNFTYKHPLISDLIGSLLAYFALSTISKSLVAAIGAIFCGLLINFTIMGANIANDRR
jgi:hypothetical protein